MADNLQPVNLRDRIGKIYKRQWLDSVLFGWITGQRRLLPSVSVRQSIDMFLAHHGLTYDDLSMEDCERTYNRMNNEFFDAQKTTSQQGK